MRTRAILLGLGLLCTLALPGVGRALDISGVYEVTVIQSSTTDPPDNCTYVGSATLSQAGSTFTGTMTLNLVSGTCGPSPLSGPVSGTLTGNMITIGAFGTFTFIGTVSANGNSMSGTWDTGDPDAVGTWFAKRFVPAPTLSTWNLAGVALLLGWIGFRRVHSM